MLKRLRPYARAAQRGLSMIELMIGTTIGLIVIAGTLSVYVSHLSGGRNLMLETRLNQELRAAADLVARDLRRAAFWDKSLAGTKIAVAATAPASNPYSGVATPSADSIEYNFSRDAVENNFLDGVEQFGFHLNGGVLQMQTAQGTRQDVTNPAVVTVTAFNIVPTTTTIDLRHLCPTACPVGTPNCPQTTVRRFDVVLRGQAVADSRIVRELRSTVRLRNDLLEGVCPP